MAVQVSDDFTGLAELVDLHGRTLNNGLGGSLSKTWTASAAGGNTGGGNVYLSTGGYGRFDYGSGDAKARIGFTLNTGDNLLITMRGNSTGSGIASCVGAFFIGGTSLRVAEFDSGGSRTDHGTKTITSTTSGSLEIEISGLVVTARVYNSGGTLVDSTNWTAGSTPGASTWICVSDYFGTNPDQIVYDNLVVEDLGGGGGGTFSKIVGDGFRLAGNGGGLVGC